MVPLISLFNFRMAFHVCTFLHSRNLFLHRKDMVGTAAVEELSDKVYNLKNHFLHFMPLSDQLDKLEYPVQKKFVRRRFRRTFSTKEPAGEISQLLFAWKILNYEGRVTAMRCSVRAGRQAISLTIVHR